MRYCLVAPHLLCLIIFWQATLSKSQGESESHRCTQSLPRFQARENGKEMPDISSRNVILEKVLSDPNFCAPTDECDRNRPLPKCNVKSPYRSLDGSCNNLEHPTWDMADDCLLRVLPAAYEGEDGIRKSVTGEPLPGARNLSLNIFTNKNRPSTKVNFWFTVFGQAVAHDQSSSTPPTGPGIPLEIGISCCPPSEAEIPECFPIIIPPDDPFYSKRNITCIEFLRGSKCSSCKENGKQQIKSFIPMAIDLHLVYGINKEQSQQLRTNDGTGRLKVQETKEGQNLLPANEEKITAFCPPNIYQDCFQTGDIRVNQHSYLTTVHTLLMREHNRMANKLRSMNPHWSGEKIFQTARKITDAKMQNIVYNEYLPLLLGQRYMDMFNLKVRKDGQGTQYNPKLRFGTWLEYTSATFRIHSMIAGDTGYRPFRKLYQNPYPLLDGNISLLIKGSCRRPSQQYDHWHVKDTTNYLYRYPDEDFGLDLVAIDIQRGRDHGLPVYIDMLNYCYSTDKKITSYAGLLKLMSSNNIRLLKQNYKDIRDIDLYVGIQMEKTMEGSVLTPTSACLAAGQFYFMKFGDRFYFEHVNQAGSFTKAQRESLKKFNMNRLICANTNVQKLQKNAFELSEETVSCLSTRENDVDLELWRTSD